MDKKFALFSFLASILLSGALGVFVIDESFAQGVSNSEDDFKKSQGNDEENIEEKQQEKKDKLEEKRQDLEEKQQEKKDKLEEKRQDLEEKQQEKKDKLEEKRLKLESDRKKLEDKYLEKANRFDEKLSEIKEKIQNKLDLEISNDVEKFSTLTEKLDAKLAKHSEKIREKLVERSEKLDSRTQKILEKINDGNYLGKKIGSSTPDEIFELVFDSVKTVGIGDKNQTSSLTGFMSFKTFDKSNSNLKLELLECQITVDDIPYNCGFGKARATSSGDSGSKDSLVILAFLEDDVIEEIHSTLKIFLTADTPIVDIDDSSIVKIHSPQSKISSMWFLDGIATLSKTTIEPEPDDSSENNLSVELTEDITIIGN